MNSELVQRLQHALQDLHDACEHWDNQDDPVLLEARQVLSDVEEANKDYSDTLQNLPLVEALWWFIENVNDDTPHRSEYFFLLRARFRTET